MCDTVNIDYLENHYDKLKGIHKALEVGSYNVNGNCKDFLLKKCINYLGIDIKEGPDVDIICDITDDIKSIAEKIGTDQYDLIICMNVLEHLYEPIKALDNMRHLLRNGGYLFIITPLVWDLHDWPHDYYRLTPDFYKKYTSDNNLKILEGTFMLSARDNRQFYSDLQVLPMLIPHIYKQTITKMDFSEITNDINGLWASLVKNNYINDQGILQNQFAAMRDPSELQLDIKYNDKKMYIFKVLQQNYFSLVLTNLSMYIPELRECWPHIYLNLICQKQ
jgi:SAM-dependent methyltransferase